MNNKVKIVAILILVVLTGFAVYVNLPTEDTSMDLNTEFDLVDMNSDLNDTSELTSLPDMGSIESASKRYIEYTQENFTNSADTKRVLFFYASWCPTCQPVDAELNETTALPEGVTVVRVNYDDTSTDDWEIALAEKYQVTYQHTFVQIDSEGNEVAKWNGGGVEELISNIK